LHFFPADRLSQLCSHPSDLSWAFPPQGSRILWTLLANHFKITPSTKGSPPPFSLFCGFARSLAFPFDGYLSPWFTPLSCRYPQGVVLPFADIHGCSPYLLIPPCFLRFPCPFSIFRTQPLVFQCSVFPMDWKTLLRSTHWSFLKFRTASPFFPSPSFLRPTSWPTFPGEWKAFFPQNTTFEDSPPPRCPPNHKTSLGYQSDFPPLPLASGVQSWQCESHTFYVFLIYLRFITYPPFPFF